MFIHVYCLFAILCRVSSITPVRASYLQFSHGQSNPTYLLELELPAEYKSSSSSSSCRFVLRKKPPGKILTSAHAVEREYQVLYGGFISCRIAVLWSYVNGRCFLMLNLAFTEHLMCVRFSVPSYHLHFLVSFFFTGEILLYSFQNVSVTPTVAAGPLCSCLLLCLRRLPCSGACCACSVHRRLAHWHSLLRYGLCGWKGLCGCNPTSKHPDVLSL